MIKRLQKPASDLEAVEKEIRTKTPRMYHADAVTSAISVIRQTICEDAAEMVAAILAHRPPGGPRTLDLVAINEASGVETDRDALWDKVETVDRSFRQSVCLRLMSIYDKGGDPRRKIGRGKDGGSGVDYDVSAAGPGSVTLSEEFCDLLDELHPSPACADLPVPDAVTGSWIATLQAAHASGQGHHLALRVASGRREIADFAGLVAASGARVTVVSDTSRATLAAAIFRAELHAGATAHVVVIEPDVLVETSTSTADDDEDGYNDPSAAVMTVGAQTTSAMPWLRELRNTYVWRVSATGELPRELDNFVGGCIGPIGYDRAWSEGIIAAMAPDIDAKGATALLAQVRDPRDVAAMVAMVRTAAAGTASSVDEACAFVARSFGARSGGLTPAQAPPPAFDPRLLVCDHDVDLFFDRAQALARNGGRLLLWGPPGGGKSSLAQALARRMVGYPTITVLPGDVLAHRWGAMERRLAALWSRAATEGAVLVIDELDSLCAARNSGESSNANYLIRSLTNEWTKHLDAHPSVPVLATVNDPLAVDDAVRRRFGFVVGVRDELPPDRERLAWASLLGLEPPVGWKPCGASVADIALAKSRCRMLGLNEPAALSEAIVRARDARLGSAAKRRISTAKSLH